MKRLPIAVLIAVVLLGLTACIRHTPESRLASAFEAADQGQFVDAYLDFSAFVEDYPEHEEAPLAARWMADCLLHQGYFERAAGQYENVIASYPDATQEVAQSTLKLGTCKREVGDVTGAIEIWQSLMEGDLADEPVYQSRSSVKGQAASLLGRTYVAMGQSEKAVDYFEIYREEALAPFDKTYSGQLLADALVRAGSRERAVDIYEELMVSESTMPQQKPPIGMALAELRRLEGDFERAVRVYDRILEATALNMQERLSMQQMKAATWIAAGSPLKAIEVYDEVLAMEGLPESTRSGVRTFKSDAYMVAGDYPQAIALLEEVLDATSSLQVQDIPYLKMQLAHLYTLNDNREQAAEIYRDLRTNNPNSAYALRGHVLEAKLYREEDPQRAEEVFNAAIRSLREAASATDTVVTLRGAVPAHLNIVYAYKDWEDYEQALAYLEEGAERFDPERVVFDDPRMQQAFREVSTQYQVFAAEERKELEGLLAGDGIEDATAGRAAGPGAFPNATENVAAGIHPEGSDD